MSDINIGMFKPYDIRTKYGNLTPELLERLSGAVALYYRDVIGARSVIISRDARLHAPAVASSLAQALLDAGVNVLLNPLPVSTCQFYHSCMLRPECGGMMVTASHNPGEYIGIKLMAPGVFPLADGCGPEGGIRKIRELYLEDRRPSPCARGKSTVFNDLDSFISYSMKLAGVEEGSLKGLKILAEVLNGSAGAEVALAFEKAGADITVLNPIPDGFFPTGDPNPIIETSIAPARKAMSDGNYDIGFCFDGDGDRLDLMHKDGSQIVPGLNMAILIKYILPIFGGSRKEFYADVKAIPVSLLEIASAGANVHIIRNGHSFIKAKLRENCDKGYFASEEESAHYYMNFPFDPEDPGKGYAAVENTLFFALLTARAFLDNPDAYERAHELEASLYRKREWPLHCEKAPDKMPMIMDDVERRMRELGAHVIKVMDDGSDLDATLMRFGLPERFTSDTTLDSKVWAQVAQRISRSEDAMCRWEVVSNDRDTCERLNGEILKITDSYVQAGFASY